ncbi:unnamed protein product [Sphenostylis stenocarpa]|uniref:Uncharacterized protein n=1 Tax=Sphenostylis stenocarpa TaxID=92480 RepID=A0AA86TFY9_9FABA|nr:unnamed protein product [Sphenostylis stenocarpa]
MPRLGFSTLVEKFSPSSMRSGVVASGIAFAVQIWCIDRGGPVFVAVYQPVQTLVVAIMASLALGEEFYLGGLEAQIAELGYTHFSSKWEFVGDGKVSKLYYEARVKAMDLLLPK